MGRCRHGNLVMSNDPGRTRTCNPLIRSQMPCPLGHRKRLDCRTALEQDGELQGEKRRAIQTCKIHTHCSANRENTAFTDLDEEINECGRKKEHLPH
ncbi:unnamed protein product [Brugia pahangi]|uniref:TRAF-type domain-containing protein n=1 Tax=Brugia pahangi TaxID=6280 RepID=A0A0N4TPK7_BRUPA|nr:unnamed protein product [Brugia pahangi]